MLTCIKHIKKVFLLAILLAFSSLACQAAWFHAGWSDREKITVKSSEINSDLSELPVYLNLKDLPSSFFSTVNGTGADIRITQGDEISETPFELVELDTVNGEGELWFKAPTLSSSTDTDFYIYYGNGDATAYADTDPYGAHNVWSNGFVAVYHMNEDPTGLIKDSTSNNYDMTSAGAMTSSDLIKGQIGKSIEFDGVNDILKHSLLNIGSSMSSGMVTTWSFNRSAFTSVDESGPNSYLILSTSSEAVVSKSNAVWHRTSTSNIIPNNKWTFSAWSSSGSAWSINVNGINQGLTVDQQDNDGDWFADISNRDNFAIGGYQKSDQSGFNLGSSDEVRVLSKVRTPDWLYAEYTNQSTPGNFYLIENGNHAGFDQSYWSNYQKVTIPASTINGDLTNFPIFVNLKDFPTSFFSTVDSTGADIRVTNGNKMYQVPFELVELDTANGDGELWFKADFLSSATDTDFYVWYGNSTAIAYDRSDEFGSENVWTQGYVAVYHMNESPTGAINDSTANENHGSSAGTMTSADLTTGQVGKSIDFDGSDDYISFSRPNFSNGNYSLSMWAKWLSKGTTIADIQVLIDNNHSIGQGLVIQDRPDISQKLTYFSGTGSGAVTPSKVGNDTWQKLNTNFNGSLVNLFVNGIQSASLPTTPSTLHPTITLAHWQGGTRYLDGNLDEVTISQNTRTQDWVITEYINQKSPGDFYLISNGDYAGFDQSFWSNYQKITIPASEINGDLTNFPVFVNLKDFPTSFFSTVDSTGADIRVTNGNKMTQVPFELVSLDTANGDGELWFKADLLSSTTDTDFYVWYGNSTAVAYDRDDEFGSENVWTEGYVGVWHMNEDPTGAINDSTSYKNHGSSVGAMTSSDLIKGRIGNSLEFDGSDDYINLGDPIDGSLDLGINNFSIQAWLKTTASITGLFSKGNSAAWYQYKVASSKTSFSLSDNSTSTGNLTAGSNINNGEWKFSSITTDRVNGNTLVYLGNNYEGSIDISSVVGSLDTADPARIAASRVGVERFNGNLDEIRISKTIKTKDWITTEFENQNAPGNFYLISNGDHAGFDQTLWSNKHKITILASEVNGDLTNFPVYVDLDHLPVSFFGIVDSNGADIRMTTNDQMTQIPFEIVELDIPGQKGELWFKAPFLSSTIDTDFYLWYGNPTAVAYDRDDEFGSENVWTEDFVAVYHLNEDGNSSAGGYKDSTANRNHGTGTSMTSSSDIQGQLGKGQDFDGSADYITWPAGAGLNMNGTFSTWINFDDTVDKQYIWVDAQDGLNENRLFIQANVLKFYGYDQASYQYQFDSGFTDTSNWHQLVGRFQNNDSSLIVDSILIGTDLSVDMDPYTHNVVRSGNYPLDGAAIPLDATIDELHLSSISRTNDWISAEFINQNGAANFYNIDNGIEDPFNPANWSNKIKITLPADRYNGDLSAFPIYFNLKDLPNSFFSTVQTNGDDIRMTQGDALTQIALELVNIDTTNGEGELWFKAPFISSTVDNHFYIYYGNNVVNFEETNSNYGSEAVWSNGFVAVYHMNEDPTGAILDSTGFSNNGSSTGSMTSSDVVSGRIGNALDFDGVNDYIDLNSTLIPTNNFTVSYWASLDTLARTEIISQYNAGPNGRFSSYFLDSNEGYSMFLGAGTNLALRAGPYSKINKWNHIVVTDTANDMSLYQHGLMVANGVVNQNLYQGINTYIGFADDINSYGDAQIDEVRIVDKPRSRDWVFTEYINQDSPGNSYYIQNGDYAGFDESFWSNYEKITIPASEINGDLTDFPVFVNLKDFPASFFSTVNGTGADIRVTNGNKMYQVPYELVELDTVNGEGELWFKADYLSSTTDTNFYVWYGNPTAVAYDDDDEFGKYAVWEDFIAVYHFSDALINGSASVINSARDAFHGTPLGGMNSTNHLETVRGQAYDFETDDTETIRLPEFGIPNFNNGTISMWLNQESTPASLYMPFDLEGTGIGGHSISMFNTGGINIQIYNGSVNQNTINTNISNNNWHYASTHWSATTGITSQRVDDTLASNSGRAYGVTNPASNHFIGSNRGTVRFFDGLMDEVRVSEKVFDADWDLADFKNQLSPGNFYLINNGDDAGFDKTLWSNFHKITVLASQINGDLSEFPVYVNLDHLPVSFFSTVDSNGADIRMTTNDQMTQIPFEIVELDIPAKKGELWFKAPFLSSTTDTDFYLWYGNPTAVAYDRDDEFGSENVWTEGYRAVYHLNEDPDLGVYKDSTSYKNNGTPVGLAGEDPIYSVLGKSTSLDGFSQYIYIAASTSLNVNSMTLSAWFNTNQVAFAPIIEYNNSSTTGVHSWYNVASWGGSGANFVDTSSAHHIIDDSDATGIAAGQWYYHSVSYDGINNSQFILDGALEANQALGSFTPQTSYPLYLGLRDTTNIYFNGTIDEAHIAAVPRSFDWVNAEYINQKTAKKFYNIDNGIEDDGEAWLSADWTNRLKITIEAAQVNGTHADFPVFIDLSDLPSSFFAAVNTDGSDIRVTSVDGQTRLPVEIVSINTTLERGEMHFKAPLLTDTFDNDFYIYYGNTNARTPNGADKLGSQAVWSNGYVAVYHMQQDPSQGTSLILDSTSYRNHGRPNGSMTFSDLVNGQMGMALDFDGLNDYIEIADSDVLDLAGTNFTISTWSKPHTTPTYSSMISKKNTNYTQADGWQYYHSNALAGLIDFMGAGGSYKRDSGLGMYDDGSWHYWTFTGVPAATTTIKKYIDSIQIGVTGTVTNITASSDFLRIGARDGANFDSCDATIDEVRISNKIRSEAWIDTEYKSHNSPSTFYIITGTVELNTDDANPKVLKLKPETKTLNTPRRHPLRMLFDKVVNVATGNFNIYQENGNIFEAIDITSGQVTGGGTDTLVITPSTYFTNAQTYYVLIDPAAIEDASSNQYAGIADPETWKFTIQGGVRDEKPLFIFDGMI